MNQEIKQKWVAALRSGEYQQGTDQLRRDNNFCCLGVLCDLHSKETNNEWEVNSYYGKLGFLPGNVMSWAGLKYEYGDEVINETGDGFKHRSLSQLNDSLKFSFTQIADIIEKQL